VFPSRRGNRLIGIVHHPRELRGEAAAAGVILCHGMESTKEGTKHRLLGERLSNRGIAALRFDFSYVGESEGDFADLTFRGEVEDLGGAWDYFRGRVGGAIGILGSSMGGTVALLFAAVEPGVRALATIAAVARPGQILAELRPLATAKGVKAHFEVSVGHPAEQIIFDADRHGVDLIVVGDRGRSKFARLLLGSVSKQVVQYAARAVMVVR